MTVFSSHYDGCFIMFLIMLYYAPLHLEAVSYEN